jgi:hypothetical protein
VVLLFAALASLTAWLVAGDTDSETASDVPTSADDPGPAATDVQPGTPTSESPTTTTAPPGTEGDEGPEPTDADQPTTSDPAQPEPGENSDPPGTTQPPTTGWIEGTVTADQDGSGPTLPAASAGTPIRVIAPDGRVVADLVSDSAGRFTTTLLEPGAYQVLATRPVGLVLPGEPSGNGGAGSTRREAEVAVVSVDAGRATVVDPAFVPWRRFSLGGGSASVPSVQVGDLGSWTYDLSGANAAIPGVIAELTIAHPAGTALGFDWGDQPSASGNRTPASNLPGLPDEATCEVRAGRTSTTVTCDIGTVSRAGRSFALAVRPSTVGGHGELSPTLRLSSRSTAVDGVRLSGTPIRLES